jgi:hypothetical protein
VVFALVDALVESPAGRLTGAAVDAVIVPALAAKAAADKIERRDRWAGVEKRAADFAAGLES